MLGIGATCQQTIDACSNFVDQFVSCEEGQPCQVTFWHSSCAPASPSGYVVNCLKTYKCYYCD